MMQVSCKSFNDKAKLKYQVLIASFAIFRKHHFPSSCVFVQVQKRAGSYRTGDMLQRFELKYLESHWLVCHQSYTRRESLSFCRKQCSGHHPDHQSGSTGERNVTQYLHLTTLTIRTKTVGPRNIFIIVPYTGLKGNHTLR